MNSLKKLGFFSAFIIPVLLITGYNLGGYYNWITVVAVYVILPFFDYWMGNDSANPDEAAISALLEERYYRFITYAWVYVQVGVLVWGAWVFATGNMDAWAKIGFVLGMAQVTGGIGITVAHELGHQKSKLEQIYAQILLMTVCYMHFFIEHNKGHHVWVATPKDPATSRKGETFYVFWFRTVIGSFKSAWEIEVSSLRRKGLNAWTYQNTMLWYVALPIVFCGLLTLTCSLVAGQLLWQIPVFFFVQSVLAFSLLEVINYIEHYGIVRREIGDGRYERVNPNHSWNANQLLTNFFLFQLQRHSDHHANATRRYQALRHFDESPQLPFGYATMVMIAILPPLWFRLMDNRLENWLQAKGSVREI
jgi:alkane 1-monooxygenase